MPSKSARGSSASTYLSCCHITGRCWAPAPLLGDCALRHNRYPGGVWRRPPPQPTSPRGPLPCAVRPHSRISTGGQAPGGCAHPWRRSAAHSGLLGSILIHSGACSRGKAKTRVSQAASTAGRTAWGRHKRMRCARSDSAHRARPGGLCAPGCALAAPQRGAQRSPRTDIGTLLRLLPTQGQNTVCVTKWRRRRRRPPPSRCRCCRRRRAQKTQRSREPSQSPPHSHRRSPYHGTPPPLLCRRGHDISRLRAAGHKRGHAGVSRVKNK